MPYAEQLARKTAWLRELLAGSVPTSRLSGPLFITAKILPGEAEGLSGAGGLEGSYAKNPVVGRATGVAITIVSTRGQRPPLPTPPGSTNRP